MMFHLYSLYLFQDHRQIEDKLINELMENYSLSDLAKTLVSLYKSNLAPI